MSSSALRNVTTPLSSEKSMSPAIGTGYRARRTRRCSSPALPSLARAFEHQVLVPVIRERARGRAAQTRSLDAPVAEQLVDGMPE